MRVIRTTCPDTHAALVEAFRHHLADRDLAPATVQAYLSDLARRHVIVNGTYDFSPSQNHHAEEGLCV